ncbi:WW domain binding protein 11-domain-containing protein [Paraphysoderma sedebokerense]|nr:WW domain binding protein 11-domain-containing protein [Paraphysoderma sedebokerense]
MPNNFRSSGPRVSTCILVRFCLHQSSVLAATPHYHREEMGKGPRTLHPADAHRRAQRQKEIKKNKEQRAKARETSVAYRDTKKLETEIERLSKIDRDRKLDKNGKEKLKQLKEQYEEIKGKRQELGITIKEKTIDSAKAGRFDPLAEFHQRVMERQKEEENQESSEEELSTENIVGLRSDSDSDLPDLPEEEPPIPSEDEDYMPPLPEGPPPKKWKESLQPSDDDAPPLPPDDLDVDIPPLPSSDSEQESRPPLPNGPPPPLYPSNNFSMPPHFAPPFPRPPPNFRPPLPPPEFMAQRLPFPPRPFYHNPSHPQLQHRQQRPRPSRHEFIPDHAVIHEYRAPQLSSGVRSDQSPPKQIQSALTSSSAVVASAAPKIRDLKREVTALVPSAVRKKAGFKGTAGNVVVNAAPTIVDNETNHPLIEGKRKFDEFVGPQSSLGKASKEKDQAVSKQKGKSKDVNEAYADFMKEMEGLI